MFSLKKTVLLTIFAVALGSIGGFEIGELMFQKGNLPKPGRIDDKNITEGAVNLPIVSLQKQSEQVSIAKREAKEKKEEEGRSSPPSEHRAAGYQISVENQAQGKRVAILHIALPASAWIAIHEDSGGAPARILGARRFDKGTHAGTVELLRATQSERIYYAMIHLDNGDHVFDSKKDIPLKDAAGKLITASFKTVSE